MRPIHLCIAAAVAALTPLPAHAEKGDQDKPINLEADRVSIDDINKVQIFEGNVVMTQGTMQLRAGRLVVTQDADGFQKGVATGGRGGLARFRQKRDGKDEYIEGEAERITHDARAEKTEFFVRAWIKSGQDEVKGHYISYEATTEKYLVTNSGNAKPAADGTPSRVRAVIQPKNKSDPAEDKTTPLTLKPAPDVTPR
ncbi:MAG: lipopolysaccharide transport periplasmic protein LptA [Candidatus Accumulibacter sp.]|jgi:lipopolysaccharide export system protein LptA|nr:lipopolysaccharide transport periplasmic protein LptA [Accumulibacter sp.]